MNIKISGSKGTSEIGAIGSRFMRANLFNLGMVRLGELNESLFMKFDEEIDVSLLSS